MGPPLGRSKLVTWPLKDMHDGGESIRMAYSVEFEHPEDSAWIAAIYLVKECTVANDNKASTERCDVNEQVDGTVLVNDLYPSHEGD